MSIPFYQGELSGCLAHLVSELGEREGVVLRVCCSPASRRCVAGPAHRPCLGESCQFGHRIAAHLAQRPGLGEIGLFGVRLMSVKSLVNVLSFVRLLLSGDLVPAHFSQVEMLCQKRKNCALAIAYLSQARTMFTIFGALSRLGRDGVCDNI